MSRLFPFPLLSAGVAIFWLLLTGFSIGHMATALLVALLVPRVMLALKPPPFAIRFGPAFWQLLGRVLVDVLRSNIAVGRQILSPVQQRQPGFLEIPLELRNPYSLAALALIVTATPGTIWVQHDPNRHFVLLHVLDLADRAAWIRIIKERYERPLLEIFE